MPNDAKEPPQANDLLKNSSLYREFQAEREEILKHKWIESEKAGRDIGFERALTDWIIRNVPHMKGQYSSKQLLLAWGGMLAGFGGLIGFRKI